MPPSFIEQIRLHPVNFLKTIALFTSIFATAMTFTIIGPTLLDLKTQVNREINEISYVITARSGGYALGSFFMGLVFEKINVELFCSVAMGVACIMTLLIPHMPDLYSLLVVFNLGGLFLGSYETAANSFLLFLWGKQVGPFMQTYDFFFGVGALIAPLIAQPFLIESDDLNDFQSSLNASQTAIGTQEELRLVIPYSIVSIPCALNSIFFFILYWCFPQSKEHQSRKETMQDVNTEVSTDSEDGNVNESQKESQSIRRRKRSKLLKVFAIMLAMLFLHIYIGLEITVSSFLVTFGLKSEVKLPKREGVSLTSFYWGAFTSWRLIAIFVIEYLGNEKNLFLSFIVIMVSNTILMPFASSSQTCLWTGIGILGVGTASIWPSLFGFLEQNFRVTAFMSSLLIISAVFADFIFPAVISNLLESNPLIFLWSILFCSVSAGITFIILSVVMRVRKPKGVK